MIDFSDKTLINRPSYFWTPDYVDVSAWIEHVPFAFWIIDVLKPKTVVELGVHNGTSYFAFCQAVKNLNINSACYGVDTWAGDEHAGFYFGETYNKVSGYNHANYYSFSTLIRTTFDEAKDYFIDGSIELLHIDGLHTYEAVKNDFDTWLPKLAENAIVIFHDINVRERNFGVFKFWDELKKQYPNFQFDFGYGLGIVGIGKSFPKELNNLFNENKEEDYYIFLRNLFSDRGKFIKVNFETKEQLKDLKKTCTNLELQQEKNKSDLAAYHEKLDSLTSQLENQHKILQWYKATFENRSIWGLLKEKLFKRKY